MALLRYWPPAAHLALVAACAATAWWRIETTPVTPSAPPALADLAAPASAIATGEADAGARDPRGNVQVLADRALFHPGWPAADPAAAGAAPASSDPGTQAPFAGLRMVGYVDQGGRRSAILETVDDGQNHVVREGDEIAGARVRQISSSAVVIEADGQRINVELYPD